MQCISCGSFLSAMACNFGCPNCGYNDGWDSLNNPSIGEESDGVGQDSEKNRSVREEV